MSSLMSRKQSCSSKSSSGPCRWLTAEPSGPTPSSPTAPVRPFEPAAPGAPSQGTRGFLSRAVEAVGKADRAMATLQDSMLPIEVGDGELRAGLQDVRRLL